jgi:hypothetical protein
MKWWMSFEVFVVQCFHRQDRGHFRPDDGALSAAPIHIFSMANLHDYHDYFVVVDLVNDPIVSLPHPISFLS